MLLVLRPPALEPPDRVLGRLPEFSLDDELDVVVVVVVVEALVVEVALPSDRETGLYLPALRLKYSPHLLFNCMHVRVPSMSKDQEPRCQVRSNSVFFFDLNEIFEPSSHRIEWRGN